VKAAAGRRAAADDPKARAIRDLRRIPGVGPSIAQDLWDLGFRSVGDLRGRSPQDLYDRHCRQVGMQVDRCLLYVFRCAVYFAEHTRHDPELLKWWNWKDREE
jgi:hypothetical protein